MTVSYTSDGTGTVRIPNVELVKLGTWAASTGLLNITPADFQAALAAAADPEIDAAPIKIGHTDARFAGADGDPALGWLDNVRLSPDGSTLIGDMSHVPAGLADILPAAFRRRSVELAFNVKTPAGKRYSMALSGLALLGVTPPAVKGLADIQALYRPKRTAASGMVADETASLLMGGATETELANARTAVAALAASAGASPAAVTALTQALDGLADAGTAGIPHATIPTGESVPMALDEKRMRELLGLSEADSLEEAVTALKTAADAAKTAPPAATTPPAAATPPVATVPPPATAPATPPAATPPAAPAEVPGATPELVGALSAMIGTAVTSALEAAGVTGLVNESRAGKINAALSEAIRSGRILPAEAALYRPTLEGNLEAGTALLSGLTPGKYPTVELGTNDPASALLAQADETQWAEFGASIGVPGLGKTANTQGGAA